MLFIQIVPFHTQIFPLSLMDPSFEDVLKHYKQLTSRSLLCFQEFYPACASETISVAITDNVWVEGRRKLNLSKEYR